LRFNAAIDDVVLYETGLQGDLLGRAELGSRLSEILENVEDSLVIALDGQWGTGKTHFLKRWVGAHQTENQGIAQTIYFDAFENDYIADPLVALVSSVATRLPTASESKINHVKKIAMKLARPAARVGLALITGGATTLLNEVGDAGVEALGDETKNAFDAFWSKEAGRQAAMAEFRSAIQQLTLAEEVEVARPLVIVIDELDRCRPDFALDVLEVIKHFFSVPHVHFILGVNLDALSSSVRVRYGSGIDAVAYLQKFISFSVSLPDYVGDLQEKKAIQTYSAHLGSKVKIPKPFLDLLLNQIEFFSNSIHISMRDVGKIISMAALLPEDATSPNTPVGLKIIAITLLITKIARPELALDLRKARIDEAKLLVALGIPSEVVSETLPNGESNINYQRRSAIVYDCWRYVLKDGNSDGSARWASIARLFDSFGDARNVKRIPDLIEYDWLSKFRVA